MTIHPNLTAVQAAAARLKVPWHEARVVSLHGRGWEALEAALAESGPLFIYTDPVHTPGAIARRLLDRGQTQARLCVLEDLGAAGERLTWLDPEEAADRIFSPLNMVRLEQAPVQKDFSTAPGLHLGMPEEAYSPERGLITKAEVRAVVLAKLALHPGQVLWDVGAGSGSVGLEASLSWETGAFWPWKKTRRGRRRSPPTGINSGWPTWKSSAARLRNAWRTCLIPTGCLSAAGVRTWRTFSGRPCAVCGRPGLVVITAALLETLEEARRVLRQENWLVDVVQLQVSRSQPLSGGSFLQALNPVWIVTGQAQKR